MTLIKELFFSENRKLIDKEIRKVVKENTTNQEIIDNILYHIKLTSDISEPTLEHSKRLRSFLCLLFGDESFVCCFCVNYTYVCLVMNH